MTRRVGLLVALLAVLGAGWLWGASGRWDADRALRAAELQNDVLEARASLLRARVSLYEADFVDTMRQLECARTLVERAGTRLGAAQGHAGPSPLDLEAFGSEIDTAKRLVATLDTQVRQASPR